MSGMYRPVSDTPGSLGLNHPFSNACKGALGVTGKRRSQMKYLIVPATVVLLGATLFLFREPIALAIGDSLVVQDKLKPADAIYVISGPDNTRIDYGIRLFQQGYARQIIFTSQAGGAPVPRQTQLNMAKSEPSNRGYLLKRLPLMDLK